MYKASFDKELLKDWCDYCEGKKEFDTHHFSTLLMETFLEGYTTDLDEFLKEITKYFDVSIYEKLAHTFSNDIPDRKDLQKWVIKDLAEKRKMLLNLPEATELVETIDKGAYLVVQDRERLHEARYSENATILYEEVSDFSRVHIRKDKRLYALKEVLYNIASDYDLVYGLLSGIMDGEVDFSNYLEIYRRGGDYAVDDNDIIIYEYQP